MHLWHVWSSFILAPDVNKSSFSSCSLVEILKKEKKKFMISFVNERWNLLTIKTFFSSHRRFSLSLTHSLHSTLSMMFVDNANWINQLNKIYWFIIVSCCVCGNDEGISCCQKRVRILILLIDRTLINCYLKVVYSINGIFIFRVKVGWNNTFFC